MPWKLRYHNETWYASSCFRTQFFVLYSKLNSVSIPIFKKQSKLYTTLAWIQSCAEEITPGWSFGVEGGKRIILISPLHTAPHALENLIQRSGKSPEHCEGVMSSWGRQSQWTSVNCRLHFPSWELLVTPSCGPKHSKPPETRWGNRR